MPPGRFFPFVLLAISITFSATAPVPMDTNKDADATLHSTAFLHRPSAFHVLEFRSAPWRRTQSTTRSDVDHDAILAGILHIPPATNAACRRDSDDCTKGFSPSTNDNTPQEPEESLSSRHDVDDNNTADEAGLGYGPWTDAATWALIVYVCASFFLLTYLWSIGWLDRRMTVSISYPFLLLFLSIPLLWPDFSFVVCTDIPNRH